MSFPPPPIRRRCGIWSCSGENSTVRANPLVLGESVSESAWFVLTPELACRLTPQLAGEVAIDLGQEEGVGKRHGSSIQRFSADDEGWLGQRGEREGIGQIGRDLATYRVVILPSRDDDVLPSGQRSADRLEGTTPHDHAVADRQSTEALEIVGQAPRQAIVDADDSVPCDCRNQRQPRRALHRCFRPWRGGRGWCIVHASLAGSGIVRRKSL